MKRRAETSYDFDRDNLISEIVAESKATALPLDAALAIARLVANDVEKWLQNRSCITEYDYRRIIVENLEKYNADLAYIYHNRDKIV